MSSTTSSTRFGMHWATLTFKDRALEAQFHDHLARSKLAIHRWLGIVLLLYTPYYEVFFRHKLSASLADRAAAATAGAAAAAAAAAGGTADAGTCPAGRAALDWQLLLTAFSCFMWVVFVLRLPVVLMAWLLPPGRVRSKPFTILILIDLAFSIAIDLIIRLLICIPCSPAFQSVHYCVWFNALLMAALALLTNIQRLPVALSLPGCFSFWVLSAALTWAMGLSVPWWGPLADFVAGVVVPWWIFRALEKPIRLQFRAAAEAALAAQALAAAAAVVQRQPKGAASADDKEAAAGEEGAAAGSRQHHQQGHAAGGPFSGAGGPAAAAQLQHGAAGPTASQQVAAGAAAAAAAGAQASRAGVSSSGVQGVREQVPAGSSLAATEPSSRAAAAAGAAEAAGAAAAAAVAPGGQAGTGVALGVGAPGFGAANSQRAQQALQQQEQFSDDRPLPIYRSPLSHYLVSIKVRTPQQDPPAADGTSSSSSSSPSVEALQAAAAQAIRSSLAVTGAGNLLLRGTSISGCVRMIFQVEAQQQQQQEGGVAAAAAAAGATAAQLLEQHAAAALPAGNEVVEVQLLPLGGQGGIVAAQAGPVMWVTAPAAAAGGGAGGSGSWVGEVYPIPVVLCAGAPASAQSERRQQQQQQQRPAGRGAEQEQQQQQEEEDLAFHISLPASLLQQLTNSSSSSSSGLRVAISESTAPGALFDQRWTPQQLQEEQQQQQQLGGAQAQGAAPLQLKLRLAAAAVRSLQAGAGAAAAAAGGGSRALPATLLVVSLLQLLPPNSRDEQQQGQHRGERCLGLLNLLLLQEDEAAAAAELVQLHQQQQQARAQQREEVSAGGVYHQEFLPLAMDLALASNPTLLQASSAAWGMQPCLRLVWGLLAFLSRAGLPRTAALAAAGARQVPELLHQLLAHASSTQHAGLLPLLLQPAAALGAAAAAEPEGQQEQQQQQEGQSVPGSSAGGSKGARDGGGGGSGMCSSCGGKCGCGHTEMSTAAAAAAAAAGGLGSSNGSHHHQQQQQQEEPQARQLSPAPGSWTSAYLRGRSLLRRGIASALWGWGMWPSGGSTPGLKEEAAAARAAAGQGDGPAP